MSKICSRCGKIVGDDKLFCPDCGNNQFSEVASGNQMNGAQQNQYGAQQNQYGAQQNQYGAQQNQYGAQQNQYGAQQNQYGAQQNQYGAQQNQYGAQQNQYGAQQNQYGAQQNQYGAQQNQYGAQQNQYGAPQPPEHKKSIVNVAADTVANVKKGNKNLIFIIGGAVLAVIIAIIVISLIAGGGYKSVAKNYVKDTLKGNSIEKYLFIDSDDFEKYLEKKAKDNDVDIEEFYKQLEDQYEDEFDEKLDIDGIEDVYKCYGEVTRKYMEEEYGEDYSVKNVEVDYAEEMSEKELSDLRDNIDDGSFSDYVESDKIKDGYKVNVDYTIKDKKGKEHHSDREITVIKYKGSWKVYDSIEI